jgi:hypothetical protein
MDNIFDSGFHVPKKLVFYDETVVEDLFEKGAKRVKKAKKRQKLFKYKDDLYVVDNAVPVSVNKEKRRVQHGGWIFSNEPMDENGTVEREVNVVRLTIRNIFTGEKLRVEKDSLVEFV